jgi:hypothetical protein
MVMDISFAIKPQLDGMNAYDHLERYKLAPWTKDKANCKIGRRKIVNGSNNMWMPNITIVKTGNQL